MAYGRLCGPSVFPYTGAIEQVVGQAVRFVLSGIGLKREAIEANYNPTHLAALCQSGKFGPVAVDSPGVSGTHGVRRARRAGRPAGRIADFRIAHCRDAKSGSELDYGYAGSQKPEEVPAENTSETSA